MRSVVGTVMICALGVLLGIESSFAGANSEAEVSLSATVTQGDTIECTVLLTSTVRTRVVDLMFQLPEALQLVSWEDGDFFANPLRIGPTIHQPTRRLLVALGVRGKQPVTAPSGHVGTMRFVRTGADSTGVGLVEAILVDDEHQKDALIAPGSPVRPAPRFQESDRLPLRFALHMPRPNPVSPSTTVSFDIPQPGAWVKIKIYDVRGRLVRKLVDERRAPGYYSEPWDLSNDGGRAVAPGVYFCRMEAGDFKDTKKLILLR